MYRYTLCGAKIFSENKLKNFCIVSFSGEPDISIQSLHRVPVDIKHFVQTHINEFTTINNYCLLDNDQVMVILYQERCILYVLKEKRQIYYNYKFQWYDPFLFCLYTLTAEHYMHIHSAGFFINDTAYALMADSGTGKSSILYGLLKNGAGYISDDQLTICMKQNLCYAFPSSSIKPKHTIETLNYFGIDSWNLRQTDKNDNVAKYFTTLKGISKSKTCMPLKALFLLCPQTTPQEIHHSTVTQFNEYKNHFIQNELNQLKYIKIDSMSRRKKIVQDLIRMNSCIDMYKIYYYKNFSTMPHVVNYINNIAAQNQERNECERYG